ncbi:MAG TPA: transporter [Vicinamibacterales bacterium]|nr:transporter [Vicinamibacterales bacterium]
MTRRVAALLLLVAVPPAGAQEPQAIEPDRPDVTNGTHIVDTGLLQIELGGILTQSEPGQSGFGSPFTARLGVSEWLEVRFGADGFVTQSDESGMASGFGNVQLGAKLRLWADPGGLPVLSILPQVNLPTADSAKGLGSGLTDFTVALLTGTDIGRHGHVDANYGIGVIGSGDAGTHFLQHLVSVSASYALTDNWNPYFETFWFSRVDAGGRSATSIDAGAIYQIGTRYALDGGAQFGLTDNAPRVAVFGGVSVIVGDVLGGHGPEERARQARARAARSSTRK